MNNTTDTNMTINWASIVVFIVVFIVVAFDGVGAIALVAVAAGVTTIFISSININGIIEAPTMTTMQRNGTGDMNAIKREKLKEIKSASMSWIILSGGRGVFIWGSTYNHPSSSMCPTTMLFHTS